MSYFGFPTGEQLKCMPAPMLCQSKSVRLATSTGWRLNAGPRVLLGLFFDSFGLKVRQSTTRKRWRCAISRHVRRKWQAKGNIWLVSRILFGANCVPGHYRKYRKLLKAGAYYLARELISFEIGLM